MEPDLTIPLDEPGDDALPVAVHARMTAREAGYAVLRAQTAQMGATAPAVLAGDAEGIHDMRVALRRFRVGAKVFEDALPARAGALRKRVAWLTPVLGAARDLDVLIEHVSFFGADHEPDEVREGLKICMEALHGRRDAAQAALEGAMRSARYAGLMSALESFLQDEPSPRAGPAAVPILDAAPTLVLNRYRRFRSFGDQLGEHPSDETLHRLRIQAKRLRYTTEFVAPLYGKPARAFIKRLVRTQDVLGGYHDRVVAIAALTELALHDEASDPRAVFAAGRLVQRLAGEAAAARSGSTGAYKAIGGKRLRALMEAMERS